MPLTRSSCFYVSSLFFLVAVTGIVTTPSITTPPLLRLQIETNTTRYLYPLLTFFTRLLYSVGICIFASAYDVIFQIFHHPQTEEPNYKNLAVFGGSYVLLVCPPPLFELHPCVHFRLYADSLLTLFALLVE